MKYLETKHEKNSAKITTIVVTILVLCCFVLGQDYQDPPEEYGVAISFGDTSVFNDNIKPSTTERAQETKAEPDETLEEEEIEEAVEEEVIEEEVVEEELIEEENFENQKLEKELENQEIEKAAEQAAAEEAAEAAKAEEAAEAEKLLAQQEEALRIKNEKDAKEKEAKEKEQKAEVEKAKAEKAAKEKSEAAKAKADAEAAQKAKAAKAKATAEAKVKEQKAIADKAEKTKIAADKAAKDKADAAAAAAAAKKKKEGSKTIRFDLIENSPIYPGCESGDNNARKKCMNDKIKQFLGKNFNKKLATSLGLSGIQKVNIFFKINESGNIVSIRAKAPDPKLEEEAKRVTKLLPKMKPGMQQGRPVTVSFHLPLNVKAD